MSSPIAQKIKEGILEGMGQNGCSLPTKAVEEIANRRANQLWVSDEDIKRSSIENAPEGKSEGYTKGARWVKNRFFEPKNEG